MGGITETVIKQWYKAFKEPMKHVKTTSNANLANLNEVMDLIYLM